MRCGARPRRRTHGRPSSPSAARARARDGIALLIVLALVAVACRSGVANEADARGEPNAIVVENRQPGSDAWRISGKASDDTAQQIEAYASSTSANLADTISFMVTVRPV